MLPRTLLKRIQRRKAHHNGILKRNKNYQSGLQKQQYQRDKNTRLSSEKSGARKFFFLIMPIITQWKFGIF
jgi:hypothetical protein